MATSAEVAHTPPDIRTRSARVGTRPVAPVLRKAAPPGGRSLAALVSEEIVPRLVLAHGLHGGGREALPASDGFDVEALVPLALADDPRALLAHLDRLLSRGVTVDTIMVDLLAPAARRLGVLWEEDRCDFVEVTIGLWRLQEVVRDLSGRCLPPRPALGRRALFAAFPGDQHGFGAAMVSEHFHQHGWTADLLVGVDMPALLAAVSDRDYDVVGLTLSCDCHSARLPSAVLALRSVSRNPQLRVLVGGRVLNEDPALAERAGADGTARDAREALLLAEGLVRAVTRAVA